jgi:hypothetical protein
MAASCGVDMHTILLVRFEDKIGLVETHARSFSPCYEKGWFVALPAKSFNREDR